jgi:hypothetical protein
MPCPETYKTPIRLPQTNVRKCSLLCSVEFIYPDIEWNMTATEIVVPSDNSGTPPLKILRYYPLTSSSSSAGTIRKDLQYNNNSYELQFMEFFVNSLHVYTADASSSSDERYDAELVLYHRGGDDGKWVNVSVFLNPMYTYSISQGFFSSLIEPLCKGTDTMSSCKKLSSSETYLQSVTHESAVSKVGAKCLTTTGSASSVPPANSSRCVPITTSDKWNPYMALPRKKAFYIYRGGFPCAESLANVYPTNARDVRWILMANTVPIHYDDYEHLRSLYKPKGKVATYKLNRGNAYAPSDIGTRPIYYNNGEYVQGNMERDQFFVRCTKKEQSPAVKSLSFIANAEVDSAPDLQAATHKTAPFLFYKPNESAMSIVMLCFIVSSLMIWVFHMTGTSKAKTASSVFLIFIAFAVFIMLLLDVTMQSAGIVIIAPIFAIVLLFVINMLLNKYNDKEMIISFLNIIKYLAIVGLVGMLAYVLYDKPSTYVNQKKYYYVTSRSGAPLLPTSDIPSNAQFFVGTKLDTAVVLAGGVLHYRNNAAGSTAGSTSYAAINGMYKFDIDSALNTLIPNPKEQAKLKPTDDSEADGGAIAEFATPFVKNDVDSLKTVRAMAVLERYDELMATKDHRYPHTQFVEAAWFALKREYRVLGKTRVHLETNIKNELDSLMDYLQNNPTS